MDPVMLRNQALQVAQMRSHAGETVDEMLASADKVYAWLVQDTPFAETAKPSTTHESEAAVVGQEPKGE